MTGIKIAKAGLDVQEWPYISRRRALRLGEVYYFDPDSPAPCGHAGQRVAITNLCVRCRDTYIAKVKKPRRTPERYWGPNDKV